jgi:hypothetical protein
MTNDASKIGKGSIVNDAIIKEISGILGGLKFGEVVIKIHDSRIIQVEKTEKSRYDNYHSVEQGGEI